MSDLAVHHSTFVIERTLNAAPARVFAAFSSLEVKSRWFGPQDGSIEETLARDFDFRVGGKERYWAKWRSGKVSDFQAVYHDIVEDERVVLVYDMYVDGEKLSTSLITVELAAEGANTRLTHTEQGAYFIGGAEAATSREAGTAWGLDNIVRLFGEAAASA